MSRTDAFEENHVTVWDSVPHGSAENAILNFGAKGAHALKTLKMASHLLRGRNGVENLQDFGANSLLETAIRLVLHLLL